MSDLLGKVVVRIDNTQLVINKGQRDNVKLGDIFQVYNLGEELFDPDTKESLGKMRQICGTGIVVDLQEKQSTILSNKISTVNEKKIVTHSGINALLGGAKEEYINPKEIRDDFVDVLNGETIVKLVKR